jgi:Protein of unknown function (DUF3417)
MSEQPPISHPKLPTLPTDVEGFDALAELALDLRSSWNHATDQVWRQLDPVLWALTHNPWVVLQTVSRQKLQRDLADIAFRKKRRRSAASETRCGGGARLVSARLPAIRDDQCRIFQHGIQ